MKKIICMLFCCALAGSSFAQKIIEKRLDFSGKKLLVMNFEIADSIRIIGWDKEEVYVKGSVNVNNNKDNDAYDVKFDESGSDISIHSHLDDNEIKSRKNDTCDCCCNYHVRVYFDVYVPSRAEFTVETINGNVTISGKNALMKAHTISGFIDLSLAADAKAGLSMHTITGRMFSSFELPQDKDMRHVGGDKVNAMLNGGGDRSIELETISGDIFLRKGS
jgi:hypothetical protein